ncbi:MAG: PqiC family protein [Stagnimonas sp.]|nr:PqiC family protein [Stagnimonas sp.]
MSPARHLSVLLAVLLLSACIAPNVAPPRRLLLAYEGAPPVEMETAAARPRLVVRAVTVPDYLDHRSLVYRAETVELRQHPQAEWAERPAKSITRWLTQALAAQRPDYAVLAYTTPDGRAPDASLTLSLDAFETGADGLLRLRGNWAFAEHAEAAALSGRFDADARPSAPTPEATVAAMQQALQLATARLVERLPKVAAP